MVKILIENTFSKISGYLSDEVNSQLNDSLSFCVDGAEHIKKVKEGKWDGYIRLYQKSKGQSFYSGLLSIVTDILNNNKIEYQIEDLRRIPEKNLLNLTFTKPSDYEEREYQKLTIEKAIKRTRGILKLATGAGKTMIVNQLISEIKTSPFMFYVLTKDLLEQAYDTLSSTLNEPVGRIGGGECDIKNINVCTIQTAIRALNIDNKKFKISDYMFDDEDKISWDEKQIENEEKLIYIRKLIGMTKGLYVDECISGDTKIVTELGEIRIDDAINKKCRFVLTHDGNNIVYKKILKKWENGIKETIKINTINGDSIKCTKNHLILTENGWKKAEKITILDKVLYANVDVDLLYILQTNIDRKNMFSGTKLTKEALKNGIKYILNILKHCHYVNADVGEKYCQEVRHSKVLSRQEEQNQDTVNICLDMTNKKNLQIIILNEQEKKNNVSLVQYLGILPFYCQTKDQKTIDSLQTTDYAKLNGRNIRQKYCADTGQKLKSKTIQDTVKNGPLLCVDAQKISQKYINTYIKEEENISQEIYLKNLGKLDLHGGFAMTDTEIKKQIACTCIQRDTQKKKMIQLWNGLKIRDIIVRYIKTKNVINTIYDLLQTHRKKYLKKYQDTYQNVCNIKWQAIKSIENYKKQKVYDIEVEDTHCFFANGILVHNCHHVAAKTVKEVITSSPNAFWKFGGSATPYREDNAELLIQAMFGKKIVDVSASYLIKKKYLVEPHIFYVPINDDCQFHSYKQIYENCIAKNDIFNKHVVDTANYLNNKGLSCLIMVQQYNQGDYLKSLIPNSIFITARMSNTDRKESINKLRNKEIMCAICSSLGDEGLDIRNLGSAILAGGGSSATRVHQRIGRTLRVDRSSNKDKSIVVVYNHDAKYLHKHFLKVKRIIETEEMFKTYKTNGMDDLKNRIDKILL